MTFQSIVYTLKYLNSFICLFFQDNNIILHWQQIKFGKGLDRIHIPCDAIGDFHSAGHNRQTTPATLPQRDAMQRL